MMNDIPQFTRYTYNEELTLAANRKRSIEHHNQYGPMVTIPMWPDAFNSSPPSHWLWPDGTLLDRTPDSMPEEPCDPPVANNGRDHIDSPLYRRTLLRRCDYWKWRTLYARRDFDELRSELLKGHKLLTEKIQEQLEDYRHDYVTSKEMWDYWSGILNPPRPPQPTLTPEQLAYKRAVQAKKAEMLKRFNDTTIPNEQLPVDPEDMPPNDSDLKESTGVYC